MKSSIVRGGRQGATGQKRPPRAMPAVREAYLEGSEITFRMHSGPGLLLEPGRREDPQNPLGSRVNLS